MPDKKHKLSGLSAKELLKKGIPAVLIPGILLAGVLGWKGEELQRVKDYYHIKTIFPDSGIVSGVDDGDTFILKNGAKVRLLGINSPERGEINQRDKTQQQGQGYEEAKRELNNLIQNKRVYLEYDRYQDDKYGRVLAWVWIDCEGMPKFKPADYMHLSGNVSRLGLTENPEGCKNGKLVNEQMVRLGLAQPEKYQDRGELKYEKRIMNRE